MIKRLTYLFFLISTCSFAQIRGAVVVAAESGVSAGFEYPALERIADIQKEIAMYQSAIAVEQGVILKLENDLYKGLSKKEKFIEGLKIIIKITDSQTRIINWLKATEKIVNDIPDLKNAFKKKELLVMLKTTVFVTDIIIATKEDESNLMNNKQRFEILNKILKSINLVEAETQSLYYFFKGIQTISVLDNYETADIDYSGVLSQLEDDYDQIFPETLKDEN